jgi:hypothetical protein
MPLRGELRRRPLQRAYLELARTIMQDFQLARVVSWSPAAASTVASRLADRIEARLAESQEAGDGGGRPAGLVEVGRAQAAALARDEGRQAGG